MSDQLAPVTSEIGFIKLPVSFVAKALREWRQVLHGASSMRNIEGDLPTLIHALEPLTGGVRNRELLVGHAGGSWTAYFDNGLRGGDPVSAVGHLTQTLECAGVVVASVPHTMGGGLENPGRYGAVQFQMFGPKGADFLNYVRTISVAHDGTRWRFDANGEVQPFEDVDKYSRRRIRERFTSEMLENYCAALGLQPFDVNAYCHHGVIVESRIPIQADVELLSIEAAQRLMGIVPGGTLKIANGSV